MDLCPSPAGCGPPSLFSALVCFSLYEGKEDSEFSDSLSFPTTVLSEHVNSLSNDDDLAWPLFFPSVVADGAADSRLDGPGGSWGAAGAAICTEMRNALATVATVLLLAAECKHLSAFVHVSTAYSHAPRSECKEEFYPSPIASDLMIEMAETVDEDILERITPGLIGDWPNTYTFSKALAEDQLKRLAVEYKIPAGVMRPAIADQVGDERFSPSCDIIYKVDMDEATGRTKRQWVVMARAVASTDSEFDIGWSMLTDEFKEDRPKSDKMQDRHVTYILRDKGVPAHDYASITASPNSLCMLYRLPKDVNRLRRPPPERATACQWGYLDYSTRAVRRPRAVVASYREPAPGWIDVSNVYGPSGLLLGIGLGVLHSMVAHPKYNVDFAPVDMVNNLAIATAYDVAENGINTPTIYNFSSTNRNPVHWGRLQNIMENDAIQVASPMAVWYNFGVVTPNKYLHAVMTFLWHTIPAYLLDGGSMLIGKEQRFKKIYNKINKLMTVLSFFTLNEWVQHNENTNRLYSRLSAVDKELFKFDVTAYKWLDFILMWCLGVRKYIVKDELKNTELAIKRQSWFRIGVQNKGSEMLPSYKARPRRPHDHFPVLQETVRALGLRKGITNTRSIGVRVGAAGADLRLFAAYHPLGSHFCSFDVHTIFDDSTPTILAGDLNAKHTARGSRVVSPAGRQLLQDSEQQGYEVIGPDTPSHIPTDPRFRADVLDVLLCHQLPYPLCVEVLYNMDTQHLPILITLGTTAHMTPARPRTHRIDWDAFRSALEELHIGKSFSCLEEVDTAAQRLTEEVQAAYSAATTRLPAQTSRRWDLPPHLKLALQKKRNLQKLWARTRCPRIKRELNHITQDLRQAVWTFRGAAWEETIEQAGEDWKSLHLLCRRLTRSPAPVCPLFDKTGTRRYAAKDRAEILAEHLEGQFTPHTPTDTPEAASHHVQVEEFLMAPVPPLPGDYFVSPAETDKMISRLPKRKAPGPDGIPTAGIRQLPRRAMVAMTWLFNGIFRTGHFPKNWKMGRVIAIPKAGKDPRLAMSQRSITLLSHIAKLFERIALRRLLRHLTPRQEQFGFRSGHSTTLQLARVLHHMAAEHNQGRHTVGVFLDMEKAFDRVFFVAVEDATSDPRPIHAGVPQGSCLSPCLYGVYTDDIPTLVGQLQDWEEDVVLALYADGSAYLASSRRADLAAAKIQRVLDLLPEWLDKWRVAIDPSIRMAAQVEQVIHRNRAARSMLRPVLRSHLPLRAKLALYKGYIRSRLTYAAPAWYALCSTSQRKRIQA
ncbi:RNA-directed DNA polymerase from mobile element jockey [Eumeta japonica]|uniref:Fatty acyl-CoA reductase n=1 Tax=Eumeta variegata TaxID=151549 RepID=A0A4C1XPX5_EUMVA|nr:RNA-directed DNA polymerase from mobile element jockey [Eumeta japonica]